VSRRIDRLSLRVDSHHPSETRLWKVEKKRKDDLLLLRSTVASFDTGWYKAASRGDAQAHLEEFSHLQPGQLVSLLQRMGHERWPAARKAALVQVAREKAYAR
jgi:hypothetical protein